MSMKTALPQQGARAIIRRGLTTSAISLVLLWLIYRLDSISRQMIYMVLPAITTEFNLTPTSAGLMTPYDYAHHAIDGGHLRSGDGVGRQGRTRLAEKISAPSDRDRLHAVHGPDRLQRTERVASRARPHAGALPRDRWCGRGYRGGLGGPAATGSRTATGGTSGLATATSISASWLNSDPQMRSMATSTTPHTWNWCGTMSCTSWPNGKQFSSRPTPCQRHLRTGKTMEGRRA